MADIVSPCEIATLKIEEQDRGATRLKQLAFDYESGPDESLQGLIVDEKGYMMRGSAQRRGALSFQICRLLGFSGRLPLKTTITKDNYWFIWTVQLNTEPVKENKTIRTSFDIPVFGPCFIVKDVGGRPESLDYSDYKHLIEVISNSLNEENTPNIVRPNKRSARLQEVEEERREDKHKRMDG